jgi:hypothetical protein
VAERDRQVEQPACWRASNEASVGLPDRERVFQVFDAVLLAGEAVNSEIAIAGIPQLEDINRRLRERGGPVLADAFAFHREWREYLVVVARARAEQGPLRNGILNGGT